MKVQQIASLTIGMRKRLNLASSPDEQPLAVAVILIALLRGPNAEETETGAALSTKDGEGMASNFNFSTTKHPKVDSSVDHVSLFLRLILQKASVPPPSN